MAQNLWVLLGLFHLTYRAEITPFTSSRGPPCTIQMIFGSRSTRPKCWFPSQYLKPPTLIPTTTLITFRYTGCLISWFHGFLWVGFPSACNPSVIMARPQQVPKIWVSGKAPMMALTWFVKPMAWRIFLGWLPGRWGALRVVEVRLAGLTNSR